MSCDVSIVTVNYNGKHYFPDYFFALSQLKTKGLTYEVIIVDNASTDGSADFIRQVFLPHWKNLQLIALEKNLGFGGGNNAGVKASQGEYVAFLNIDTAVDPLWLSSMVRCIRKTGAGIVNAKMVFFWDFLPLEFQTTEKILVSKEIRINEVTKRLEGKFQRNCINKGNSFLAHNGSKIYLPFLSGITDSTISITIEAVDHRGKLRHPKLRLPNGRFINLVLGENHFFLSKDEVNAQKVTLIQNAGSRVNSSHDGGDIGFGEEDHGQYDQQRELDCACGAGMIMSRHDFDELGGFDESFFMYYEDTDLSYRLKKNGKKIIFCPKALVRHVHAGSSQEWSPFFLLNVIRSKTIFISKHFPTNVFIKEYMRLFLKTGKILLSKESFEMKRAVVEAFFEVSMKNPVNSFLSLSTSLKRRSTVAIKNTKSRYSIVNSNRNTILSNTLSKSDSPITSSPSFVEYKNILTKHGHVGGNYLEYHYYRFCKTKEFLESTLPPDSNRRLLDVGSMPLYQSMLYAKSGFKVTSVEIDFWPDLLDNAIKSIASEYNIRLISYKDLSNPIELKKLPANSFDVILFTEIIEHITFNPVNMWREFYRLLVPGGRIVITTPSYFFLGDEDWGWTRDVRRLSKGLAPGISAKEIVETSTFGHHWRLFSKRDICEYFRSLSEDFKLGNVRYFNYRRNNLPSSWISLSKRFLQRLVPPFMESIYVEVVLKEKKHGIHTTVH